MKNVLLSIYRCIVGEENGFTGEGNELWYYSLSLVINLMLVWWINPEIALVFTILAVIHYLTAFVYGYFDLIDDGGVSFAYAYFGIHFILLSIAIWLSFKWAIITMVITTVAFFSAPDCTGKNIFLHKPYGQLPLLFNTIIFAAFVVIDFLLPIKLWIKLLIIVAILLIHPVIDYFEGECVLISDTILDSFEIIKESKESRKNR